MQYSIINFQDVVDSSNGFRIDADFFHPTFLDNEKLISKEHLIGSCVRQEPIHKIGKNYNQKFYYLEISNISLKNGSYECYEIDPLLHKIPYRATYKLKNNDVVVSTVRPNRNVVAFIHKAKNLVAASGCAVLRTSKIPPEYLFAFCKTEFFIKNLVRANTATMYPAVSINDILEVPIFLPRHAFMDEVKKIIQQSISYTEKAKEIYKNAQSMLLTELGLNNWRPKRQLTFVKNSSDVQEAGRIDAEHFQPQYDEIIQEIKKYEYTKLGDIVLYKKGIEVGSDSYVEEGIPFIRVSDISDKGIERVEKTISKELYDSLPQAYSPQQGDILMTKDGTIGLSFVVEEDITGILNSAFLMLRVKENLDEYLNREYLSLVINSILCKKQIEKHSGGAIIDHLRPEVAMDMIIPILNKNIQKKISAKIIERTKLNRQSLQLLEIAKRGVEMAMEKNEKVASQWIEREVQKIDV